MLKGKRMKRRKENSPSTTASDVTIPKKPSLVVKVEVAQTVPSPWGSLAHLFRHPLDLRTSKRNLSPSECLIAAIHRGDKDIAFLTLPECQALANFFVMKLKEEAFTEEDFMSLSHEDRSLLLFQNSRVYAAHVICQYLAVGSENNGNAQLSKLIQCSEEETVLFVPNGSPSIQLSDVQSVIQENAMGQAAVVHLEEAIRQLEALYEREVTQEMIFKRILFNERNHLTIDDRVAIAHLKQSLLTKGQERSLNAYLSSLQVLSSLVSCNLDLAQISSSSLPPPAVASNEDLLPVLVNRAREIARFASRGHCQYLKSLPSLESERATRLTALLMVRLHEATSVGQQLADLGQESVGTETTPPAQMFWLQSKKPFLRRSLDKLSSLLVKMKVRR